MKRTWSQANAHEYGQLGIIESVKLRNFMCHDNLSFDFDPRINFIVGRNGSGKSAVLTGIILALGGKSNATGRFSNIKGFVKTGKNSASVSVTLMNCGPDAHKPDDYGKKITIERRFTSDGVSSYKLKSETGRIISSSKEELTNILNVMDIQIENPVTVLTQDTSRNFLVSKNSKGDKLFKLFYEGTGLSKVYDDYNRAMQSSQEAQSDLNNKKAVVLDNEKQMKTLKALLHKSAKKEELEKELLWAMVIKYEAERDAALATLQKAEKEVSDLTKQLDHNEAEIAEISGMEVATDEKKKGLFEKMDSLRQIIQELDTKKSALMSEIRETQGTCSRHEREVEKVGSEISSLVNIMNEIRLQNKQNRDGDKLRHETTLRDLQNQIGSSLDSIRKMNTRKNVVQEKLEETMRKIDACQEEIADANCLQERIKNEKQQIFNGLKNRLNVFGSEMANVLQDITVGINAGNFKERPKGPIGLYIDVKKPEWNFAIQECLKISLLKTFLCDNHEDGEQLSKIFSKHYQRQRPSIIISKFVSKVYDVSAHKCVYRYPTVLDMLNIKDSVIANCLIDQKQIENILLVDDPAEARNLMLHNPPEKCCFVYSLNGDQFYHSPVRKYSCRNRNRLCLLKSINKDDIKKKDEEIIKVEASLKIKIQEKEKLTQHLNVKVKEIRQLDKLIFGKELDVKHLRMKLTDEESSYSEPKDINTTQTDLDELKRVKASSEKMLDFCKEVIKSKTKELNILNKELDKNKGILREESVSFHQLSEEMNDYQSRKEKLDGNVKKVKSLLGRSKSGLDAKNEALKNWEGTVKSFTDRAEGLCPRIDTERSVDTLRHLVREMDKFLEEKKVTDRGNLFDEYKEKVENCNQLKEKLSRQVKINDRLLKMIAVRFQEFRKICKNTSVSLTCTFTTLLKENNFTGYPDISFESKTLEIFAKPEKSKSKFGDKPNLSQLSGGERSFVTIAFLLSLWDRIHSPFRILDEYDVFMDSNNRHLSIHLLINTAKSNKTIQYIFLSPLELPHIEDSDHVKVHRMPAPRNELDVNLSN